MKKTIFFLILLVCFSLAYAIPDIPTQIYGEINQDLPDGTEIAFKVDGTNIGSGSINDNKYGYDEVIFLDLNDQDSVSIYIAGIEVDELETSGEAAIKNDIIIPDGDYQAVYSTASSGSSGGSSGGSSSACTSVWECSDWSECSKKGKETRLCFDLEECEDEKEEERSCNYVESTGIPSVGRATAVVGGNSSEGKSSLWIYISLIVLVAGAIAGTGFFVYERNITPSLSQNMQNGAEVQTLMKLENYTKQALARGYPKELIRQALFKEGWKQEIVDNVFVKIKK